jgi:glycosyl transferase family 1
VAATLSGLGYEVRPVADPDFALAGDALVWMTGGPHWFPTCWRRLLDTAPDERPPVVLWHTEPLPLPRAAALPLAPLHARELAKIVLRDSRRNDPRSNFRRLRRLLERGLPHVLAVSTLERQEFLAEHGIDSEFVPYGYRAESHGRDLGLERDIDVLFLGSLDVPRRKRILRRLERDGVAVEAVGSWHDPTFWGENRTRLLNRVKVLLNLPRHPGLLSGVRMLLGMANKALVVAEPVYRPSPYRPGVHYVSASLDEMPEAIGRYLADEESRRRITDVAYRFVTEELTMERSAEAILRLVPVRA